MLKEQVLTKFTHREGTVEVRMLEGEHAGKKRKRMIQEMRSRVCYNTVSVTQRGFR